MKSLYTNLLSTLVLLGSLCSLTMIQGMESNEFINIESNNERPTNQKEQLIIVKNTTEYPIFITYQTSSTSESKTIELAPKRELKQEFPPTTKLHENLLQKLLL